MADAPAAVGDKTTSRTSADSDSTDSNPAAPTGPADPTAPAAPPRRRHPVGAIVLNVLAAALVMFALVAPNTLDHLTPTGFLRIPVEGLLFVVFFLALPNRAVRIGRVVTVIAGVGLGLLTIVKFLDMGFYVSWNRQFDLLLDFPLAGNGLDYLHDAVGPAGAIGAAVAIVLLIIAVMVLMTLSVRRLTPMVQRHRTIASRAVVVLGVAWVTFAVLGSEIVPYTPVASRSATAITVSHALAIPTDLRDNREFDKVSKIDAFRDTPPDQLLTSLKGKDVVVAFVESYGRGAIENPDLAPQIDATLDDGSKRLKAAGFTARSGFLTSPTSGGGSWLAQSTLMSGLWVKNQSLYNKFIASDRMTLNGAFGKADWRTLAVAPGIKKAWPEARVFGFDKIYDAKRMEYEGPRFAWSWMPDQYTLSHFQKTEYQVKDRPRLMAEIPLTSSHMPWTPLPKLVDWDAVGNGSIFTPMAKGGAGAAGASPYGNQKEVRVRYREAIKYTLSTLISYLEKYGDDNLVMVFLGDHEPIPLVVGQDASHDVPITIVAKDPKVFDRIADWKWQDGINPNPKAPVWRMDTFRDRFLTAFGPKGDAAAARATGGKATAKPAGTPSATAK